MSLTRILGLIVIGGIAAGAYYYRDGIKNAVSGFQKTDEERALDVEIKKDELERKREKDDAWDNSPWNPDNWFGNNQTNEKTTTVEKQPTKYNVIEPINVVDPVTGERTITYIPNLNPKQQKIAGWY